MEKFLNMQKKEKWLRWDSNRKPMAMDGTLEILNEA